MNIYEKLAEARYLVQKSGIEKSGHNKFSNFYYHELKDFMPSAIKVFKDLKMTSIFNIDGDVAELVIINAENPEEFITFRTPIEEVEAKNVGGKIHALGAMHTYLKRYLYFHALEIVENDQLDRIAGSEKEEEKKAPARATTTKRATSAKSAQTGKSEPKKAQAKPEEYHSEVVDLIAAMDQPDLETNILKGYQVESIFNLSEAQSRKVISVLNQRLEKKLEG